MASVFFGLGQAPRQGGQGARGRALRAAWLGRERRSQRSGVSRNLVVGVRPARPARGRPSRAAVLGECAMTDGTPGDDFDLHDTVIADSMTFDFCPHGCALVSLWLTGSSRPFAVAHIGEES